MTNSLLLKAKIMENGLTIHKVAEMIGISHTSMSYKINNKRDFTVKEICALCETLKIDDKDIYFFTNKVGKMATQSK